MKIAEYKGKKLCSGLVAYNFYKKLTGKPLQADSIRLNKLQLVQEKLAKGKLEEISDAELKLFDEIDFISIVEGMYCAFRQAADPELRKYNMEGVIEHDELDMEDIGSSGMMEALGKLIGDDNSKK